MYETGYLEKEDFAARVERVKERLERETKAYDRRSQAEQLAKDHATLRANSETFADHLKIGLQTLDFTMKRQILRLLIKRIEVTDDEVQIVYKVQPHAVAGSPQTGNLQHPVKLPMSVQGRAVAGMLVLMGSVFCRAEDRPQLVGAGELVRVYRTNEARADEYFHWKPEAVSGVLVRIQTEKVPDPARQLVGRRVYVAILDLGADQQEGLTLVLVFDEKHRRGCRTWKPDSG
jgi:hypothetical protein